MCRTPTNLVPAMVQRPGGRHDRKRIHNNIIECAMEWDSIYNRARSIMWYMYVSVTMEKIIKICI